MSEKVKQLHQQIKSGSFTALARGITIVENDLAGNEDLLMKLSETAATRVVGITGPPGAGKSTLVNALLCQWLKENKRIAVIAIDPSSPFNYGALLGDRIRMAEYYTNPNIFIRSLATRGALGGLSGKIIEITDLVKEAGFDIVLVETVGVGQSEVEIAGLADCTVVTLVPGTGDEVQNLKSGIMEIADIFVVNKADNVDAEQLYRSLRMLVHERAHGDKEIPVLKTIATEQTGIEELALTIIEFLNKCDMVHEKKFQLLAEKCRQLIQHERMRNIDLKKMNELLKAQIGNEGFNIYVFVSNFMKNFQ